MILAIAFRSIERIVAVAIGVASIYLGYRLFVAVPLHRESEGKVVLPGDISIYLSKIGPGAFFALVGAIIVAVSFQQTIMYREGLGTSPEASEQPRPASSRSAELHGIRQRRRRQSSAGNSGVPSLSHGPTNRSRTSSASN